MENSNLITANCYTTTHSDQSYYPSGITVATPPTNTVEEPKYLKEVLEIVNKYGIDSVKEWCKDMGTKKKEEEKKKLENSRLSPRKTMPALINVTFQEDKGLVCAIWEDGSRTFVKNNKEEWDPVKGMAMAICKKYMGDNYDYIEKFKKLKTIRKFYEKGNS